MGHVAAYRQNFQSIAEVLGWSVAVWGMQIGEVGQRATVHIEHWARATQGSRLTVIDSGRMITHPDKQGQRLSGVLTLAMIDFVEYNWLVTPTAPAQHIGCIFEI